MGMENLKKTLNPGKFAQVGIVVRDLKRAMENYESTLGIGPFATIEFKPETNFVRGRKGNIHLKIGIARLSPEVSLELLQVVSGEPYHKDFLEKHGEGVQHLGFFTDEYDRVLKRAEEMGISVLMSAETDVPGMGHIRGAYLDTLDSAGTLIEIIEIKN